MPVPPYHALFNPVLEAMRRLGDSASISELDEEVIKCLKLPEVDVLQAHDERQTELEYRLAWARTYLKSYGLLDNTGRGVWVLTAKGRTIGSVQPQDVVRYMQKQRKARRQAQTATPQTPPDDQQLLATVEEVVEQSWRERLLKTLLALAPEAFERLCQRLLRESGFVQVRVTGRSGDGGIDGVGIVQLGGLLGFPVLFQCKRYQGSVGASTIRDFRGAMIGRSDRGIILTTGSFSPAARTEATRDGAPPIDLVDGEQLLDKLKDLRLGVGVRMIEDVSIEEEWFNQI